MSEISKKIPGSAFLHRPIVSQKGLQYFKILSSFIKLLESESRLTTHISRHLLGTLLFIQHFCSGESGSKIEASTNISLKAPWENIKLHTYFKLKVYLCRFHMFLDIVPARWDHTGNPPSSIPGIEKFCPHILYN